MYIHYLDFFELSLPKGTGRQKPYILEGLLQAAHHAEDFASSMHLILIPHHKVRSQYYLIFKMMTLRHSEISLPAQGHGAFINCRAGSELRPVNL